MNLIDIFKPEDIITADREDNQSVFHRLNNEKRKVRLTKYRSILKLWNMNIIGGTP